MLRTLVLIPLLAGCSSMSDFSRMIEPARIRNESCYQTPYMKILQVLDDGVLAHLCPTNYPYYYDNAFDACSLKGDLVFMEVPKDMNYFVDEQKIELPSDSCFMPQGTYSYLTKNDIKKTVRMIKIDESTLPNPRLMQHPPSNSQN